ncbi:MAG: Cytochrome c oxidase subunit 4 [Ramalina farinacea]|uniref:Cytochrome c oxidase subunit 4, mitochondrial n=1 Tax=Ramalina farinacea TaxID=258253 RepID=A0AA43QQA2_9LECA|nr:Cytochrome c oxidase subunit 4 [Ramalina farinacea]
MMLRRSAAALSRRVVGGGVAAKPVNTRMFTPSITRYASHDGDPKPGEPSSKMVPFEGKKHEGGGIGLGRVHPLRSRPPPPGARPGTMPTDLEQSTGLERFEILGKMQGIDVFDMKPLDASRRGTLDNPIIVNSAGDEQFAGCTGFPADSHWVIWLGLSRARPLERCTECGSVYRMEYIGPPDEAHGHGHGEGEHGGHGDAHHNYEEPKTMADFVRPEYRGAPPGFVHPGATTAGEGAHH